MYNEFDAYMRYLNFSYGAEAQKFFILKLLASCYKVFAYFSGALSAPLGVTADSEGQLNRLVKDMTGFNETAVISLGCTPKEMKFKLLNADSEVIFVRYSRSPNGMKNIHILQDYCRTAGEKLIMVLSAGAMPDELDDFLLGSLSFNPRIGFTYQKNDHAFLRSMIPWVIEHANILETYKNSVPQILKQFPEDLINDLAPIIMAYHWAVDLNYYCNGEEGKPEEEKFSWALAGIIDELESDNINEVVVNTFLKMLKKSSSKVKQVRYIENEVLSVQDVEDDYLLMVDSKRYIISEVFFLKICESLAAALGISRVKRILDKAGILISEGKARKYWTCKVQVIMDSGTIKRVHRTCLYRAEIDKNNAFPWDEIVKMTKGRMKNE